MKALLLQVAFAGCLSLSASAVTITMGGAIGGAITSPGSFTVATVGTAAGANNHPAAEAPPAVTDALSSTKYLNFFELNTGVIVSPTVANMILTGISFTTANDAPERDPLTFSIYGSASTLTGAGPFSIAGLTPLTLDASTGLTVDPGRFQTGAIQGVTSGSVYASYLIVFPTVRNSATANSMQIADINFDGRVVPEPGVAALGGIALAGLLRRRRR